MTARTAKLRGSALELQTATDPEILLHGPARTGKSFAALLKADMICREFENARVLFIRKTRKSMAESILQTFEDHILTLSDDRATLIGKGNRGTRDNYVYDTGSRIVLAGLNNADDWANVMSSEWDLIILFEALQLRLHDYESLTTRLSNFVVPYQQIIADTNPGQNKHHLRQRQLRGDMRELRSYHKDNPRLHDGRKWTKAGAEYMTKLRKLTGNRRIRLLDGDWCSDENVVFRSFNEAKHNSTPYGLQLNPTRYRVFTYSQVRPSVCQWWALNDGQDGMLFLYREIYTTGLTMGEFIAKIKHCSTAFRKPGSLPETYEATITNPDDFEASAIRGIECTPATDDFKQSVAAVEDRLFHDELAFDPEALVEVDPCLVSASLPTCTVDEFELYSYPLTVEGKPISERPVDMNCAAMDCLRWICEHLENGSCGVAREPNTPDDSSQADGWEMLAESGRKNRVNARTRGFSLVGVS